MQNFVLKKAKNPLFQWLKHCGKAKYLLDVELNTLDVDADNVPIFGA